MNRYPAPRGGRDRAPTAAAAAAQAMGDEHSGSAQVRVQRWLVDLRVHRRAAPEAGHVAQRSLQGPGPQEDAEAEARKPAAPAAGAEAESASARNLPGVGTASGRPSTAYLHRKGGASARRAQGTEDRDRLNKNPTKARPQRVRTLRERAQQTIRAAKPKPRQRPASLVSVSPSNLGPTEASQICSPDQVRRLRPSSC